MNDAKNSVFFRSYLLENDDRTKTIVKIEPDHMEQLGIKEGDIVKISGNCNSLAFCFSLNKKELENIKSQDPQIEYLNPDHVDVEYPRIILSSITYSNVCPTRQLRLVSLENISSIDSKNIVPEAEIITLGTMKFAENAMPGYKDNINFSSLLGQLVKKQQRVNASFLPEFEQKHQRTSGRGHSIPPNFSSVIVNVKPENNDFWLVTKNTKFNFQEISMDEFKGKASKPEAISFIKSIPVPYQFQANNTDIVFTSLEIFENSMKLRWYSLQRIKIPEEIFSNPSKTKEIQRGMGLESAELTIEIRDDLGNVHSDGFSAGGGGSSGPDPTTKEMVFDYSGEYRFNSALNPNAKGITIIVKDIMWVKSRGMNRQNATAPPKMTMDVTPPKLLILEGPWEFKLIL